MNRLYTRDVDACIFASRARASKRDPLDLLLFSYTRFFFSFFFPLLFLTRETVSPRLPFSSEPAPASNHDPQRPETVLRSEFLRL